MKIKDIVNKTVAQITTCDSEPIHIPGSIQPHGTLLAVDNNYVIRYCSGNVPDFLGNKPEQLLQQSLDTVWPELHREVENFVIAGQVSSHPSRLTRNDQTFDVFIHDNGSSIIIEAERHIEEQENVLDLFDQTRRFVSHIDRSHTLQGLCQHIADETRNLTGYDRVMIYRFDKQYNGEVYAESVAEGVEAFLGLHYPHADIPPQARELYLKNLLRMIVDVDYAPVPLLTTEDVKNPSLDLGQASLRSVSPIHIQYLRNMEVKGTMTISLIQEGRLWGLIACHHREPKYIPYVKRQIALMQGHFLSSQIRSRMVAEEYEVNVIVEAHLQQLLNKVDAEEEFEQKFDQFTSILAVTNSSGVAIVQNGELYTRGLVPQRMEIVSLIRWLDTNVKSVMYSSSSLSRRYTEGQSISKFASGIIYHALGKPTENCIIWFRQEKERTINWAGNPAEAIQKNDAGYSLTPRKSFALWKENVRFQSAEWRVSELNAASRFASVMQNHFHLLHLHQEELRLRLLNDQLTKANAELSNINWITSHDLKEPLRKILVFASRIVDAENQDLSESIKSSIDRIQKSATRMQHLVDDILSYSVAGQKDTRFEIADMNVILKDVLDDLNEDIQEHDTNVTIETLPDAIRVIPHQMRQLFTNLISNALKFARQDVRNEISIHGTTVSGADEAEISLDTRNYYKITVTDNGIGFDKQFNRKIFELFYRLHNQKLYTGTGIGLAICKKIVENNNGHIIAAGETGKGARFSIYLPA